MGLGPLQQTGRASGRVGTLRARTTGHKLAGDTWRRPGIAPRTSQAAVRDEIAVTAVHQFEGFADPAPHPGAHGAVIAPAGRDLGRAVEVDGYAAFGLAGEDAVEGAKQLGVIHPPAVARAFLTRAG